MAKPKPLPTDADFEAAILEFCRAHPDKDLVEGICLLNAACAKIEERFSRRAIRLHEIRPQVSLAVERLVACGRLREFSMAHGFHSFHSSIYNGFVYALILDREQVLDLPAIEE
jgi:hypothetical protein